MAYNERFLQQFSGRTSVGREPEKASEDPFLNDLIHALAAKYSSWQYEDAPAQTGGDYER